MEKSAKKRKISFSNVLFAVIMIIVIILGINILSAKAKGESPNIFGIYFYRVETDSMYPVLPRKSIIISKKVKNFKDIKAGADGDIVTFYNKQGERVTHRIVEEVYDDNGKFIGYRTKGDNPLNSVDSDVLMLTEIEAVFIFKLF